MTNKELVELLQSFDADLEVVMWVDGYWSPIHQLKIDKHGSLGILAEFGED